jgi:hypothetical protein
VGRRPPVVHIGGSGNDTKAWDPCKKASKSKFTYERRSWWRSSQSNNSTERNSRTLPLTSSRRRYVPRLHPFL